MINKKFKLLTVLFFPVIPWRKFFVRPKPPYFLNGQFMLMNNVKPFSFKYQFLRMCCFVLI